jgi:DNA-binding transcriptional ArsR family regulator
MRTAADPVPHTADIPAQARIAKALAHPLRARILQHLGERIASPVELADALDAPIGVVSYHVQMLCQYECAELVRIEPRRGALQHFYRAAEGARADEGLWPHRPSARRRDIAGETINALVDDLQAASRAGTLADEHTLVTRTPLELDERARRQLNRVLSRALDQALAIAAESAGRHDQPTSDFILGEIAILHFQRARPRMN